MHIDEILTELEHSGQSAALAVAEHIRCVRDNGAEQATRHFLQAEALQLTAVALNTALDLRVRDEPDGDMNGWRAKWAAEALTQYAKVTNTSTEPADQQVSDLLCNLLHPVDRQGHSVTCILERGIKHYIDETQSENKTQS